MRATQQLLINTVSYSERKNLSHYDYIGHMEQKKAARKKIAEDLDIDSIFAETEGSSTQESGL